MKYWISKSITSIIFGLTIVSFAQPSQLIYSTYLRGNDYDEGDAIAVDNSGNAYIAGATFSGDFPSTSGSYDTTNNGSGDIFVIKLNSDGSGLIFGTFIGGSYSDSPNAIALDSADNVYITGRTSSTNYPVTTTAYDTSLNNSFSYYDVVVTKLNSAGTDLVYSTYIGGSGDEVGYDIALDNSGNAYITGYTNSSNYPVTPTAYDTSYNGNYVGHSNVFVTKLNPDGTGLVYSTFIGGTNHDAGYGIALDNSGNVYITGVTSSNTFPVTSGVYQSSLAGYNDSFVCKLNAAGSALLYSTYLGGGHDDETGSDIAIDNAGNAYIAGLTYSDNYPTTPYALMTSLQGNDDAFVTVMNSNGTGLLYSTYLGGTGIDFATSIVLDNSNNIYLTGQTRSSNFPVTPNAYDASYNGGSASIYAGDVFVSKLSSDLSRLKYSTFLGGNNFESGSALALDTGIHAYVTGYTQSSTFPVTLGAFDTTYTTAYQSTNSFAFKLLVEDYMKPVSVEERYWKVYSDFGLMNPVDINRK